MSRAAGIPSISSHVGRHTNITGQIRAGVPLDVVAARAGHKNSSVTIRSYRRVLDDELRSGAFSIRDYRASDRTGKTAEVPSHVTGAGENPIGRE